MTEDDPCFPLLNIRYEGNDAIAHQMDLSQLGVSLQGFARIFAVSANLLKTGKLNKHLDALEVRVMAVPTTEHRCFEFSATIVNVVQSKELWSGVFGALLTTLVQYVLSRKDKEEMKYLSEALKQALQNNQGTVDKLVATIDKMADALRPAARQALTPVERSCKRIDMYADGQKFHSLDAATKQSFMDDEAIISDHAAIYSGLISEFDMTNGACRVTLEGETSRIPALVTDPIYSRPNNAYVEAMAASRPLRFVAKAELDAEGNILKLYISDTAEASQ